VLCYLTICAPLHWEYLPVAQWLARGLWKNLLDYVKPFVCEWRNELMPANAPAPAPVKPASPGGVRQPGKVTTFLTARFQLWGTWTLGILFAGFLVICLLVYLLVQWVSYSWLVWGNASSSSVTLIRDIGHGGLSQITITFSNHTLFVIDVDNNDPQRTTVLRVNEEIAIPDNDGVVTASLEPLLQANRLDLVIKIKGGLAYHTEFATILVNNVEALQKDPHAPGLREPTASELQQARQKLGA
jgi:hypothetical protein